MTEAIIRTEELRKHFGKLEVLRGITTEIRRGEVVSIIGPSGGGKSTFLRCLNRLEVPDGGRIYYKGKEVTGKKGEIGKLRQEVGMVFQHFNVFPNMTVLDNVTLAPILEKKLPKEKAREDAMALLTRVGLAEKAEEYPRKLSGGQKQRLAIVRALGAGPGDGQGGAARDRGIDPQRHDDPHRDPRNGVCARGIRQGAIHQRRHHQGRGTAQPDLHKPPRPGDDPFSQHGAVITETGMYENRFLSMVL